MKNLRLVFAGVITSCCFAAMGEIGYAAERVATLEDQLISAKPGDAFLASPTEAVFLPKFTSLDDCGYSPVWTKKPVAVQKLPEDWPTKVGFDDWYGRSRAIVKAPQGTDFYGTGLVMGALRRNGTNTALWATDNYMYKRDKAERLYEAHPWVLAVRKDGSAFGVIADTTWRASIQLTESEIIVDSEGPAFPVVILEGKTPQEVLVKLAERTGKTPMPALWTLGYQQSRWSYDTAERGLEIASEFRKRKIPADVIWMDIDYMQAYKVFTFHPERFPNPREYTDKLHEMGFKNVWMIDPGVKAEEGYFVFDSGNKHDVWVKKPDQKTDFVGNVWPGRCKFPDFTREETRRWWASLYKDFIVNNDIDGIWNDMDEPAVFSTPGHTMPVDNYHRGDADMVPGSHLKYHNIYGMLMMRASREGILAAKPNKRPFVLSRSNFLGGQRYGATWTGDNCSTEAHMKVSIPMSLNLSLSGQPFNGPDMGGFGKNASPELWADWVSFGSLFPFCRGHAVKNSQNKEPWAYGPETETVARTAIERRYRLIPYFYTLFRSASVKGTPVMMPVFCADPADTSLRREEVAFMMGEDILVVPNFAKNPSLPKGDWRDVNVLENESDKHPKQAAVKIRPGAIVPLGKVVQHTGEPMLDELTLVINPSADGKAVGELYEDAGDGYEYTKGDYCLLLFTCEKAGDSYVVSIKVLEGNRKPSTKKVRVRVLTGEGEKSTDAAFGPKIEVK